MPLLYAIGLGGTGSSIILKFAEKFRDVISEAQEKGVGIGVKVQIIDLAKEPAVDAAVKSGLLTPDDVYVVPSYIVEQEKSYLPVLADSKPWFPKELRGDLLYRVRGEHGVERRRPVARLVFHAPQVAWSIYNVLRRDIEDLIRMKEAIGTNVIYVVIIASLGGGWGSGTFIDVAALVRNIIRRVAGETVTPIVIGILILPHGYATRPPAGIRVEFEEENAVAALRELYLLYLYHRFGLRYSEEVGNIGEVVYSSDAVKLFDVVFLASYGNVLGATYVEQFEKLDSAIADFLAFLALMPSTADELRRMEKIVSGITLSENLLQSYNDAEMVLSLPKTAEEVKEPRWRPLVSTFGIAEYGIDLVTLSKYFEMLKRSQEINEKIGELEKQKSELEKKLVDAKAKLIDSQTKLSSCLDTASRLIKGEEVYKPPASIENIVLDEVKKIEQDPVGYNHRRELMKFIRRIKSEVGDNITALYLVLRFADQKLRELELKYGEELSNIEKNVKIKEKELDSNIKILESMSITSKILRKDKEYKESIKRLQEEIKTLKATSGILREKVDGIRVIRDDLSSQISSVASSARAEDLCIDIARIVSENQGIVRSVETELNSLNSELNSARKILNEVLSDLEKMKLNPVINKLRIEFGEKIINALMDQWKRDPENFTKLTIEDINKMVSEYNIGVDVFERFISNLNANAKPLLVEPPEVRKCYDNFYREFLSGKVHMQHHVKIVVATPKDIKTLADKIGSTFTIQLSHLGANAKLVVINPVIPLPCTEEFKSLYAEYRKAIDMGIYTIHVLPVTDMIKTLENKIKGF